MKGNTWLTFNDPQCPGYTSFGFHQALYPSGTEGFFFHRNDRCENPNTHLLQSVKFTNCVQLYCSSFGLWCGVILYEWYDVSGHLFDPIVKLDLWFYQVWGWDRKVILKRRTIPAILLCVITTKSYITSIVVVKALHHIATAVPAHLNVSVAKKPKIIL